MDYNPKINNKSNAIIPFDQIVPSIQKAIAWIQDAWNHMDPALRQGIKTSAYLGAGIYAAKRILYNYTDLMREDVVKPLGNADLSFWQRHRANDFCRSHRFYVTTFPSTPPEMFYPAVEKIYRLIVDNQNHGYNLGLFLELDAIRNLFHLPENKRIDVRIRDADTARIWIKLDLGNWSVGELYKYFINPRFLVEFYDTDRLAYYDLIRNLVKESDKLKAGIVEYTEKGEIKLRRQYNVVNIANNPRNIINYTRGVKPMNLLAQSKDTDCICAAFVCLLYCLQKLDHPNIINSITEIAERSGYSMQVLRDCRFYDNAVKFIKILYEHPVRWELLQGWLNTPKLYQKWLKDSSSINIRRKKDAKMIDAIYDQEGPMLVNMGVGAEAVNQTMAIAVLFYDDVKDDTKHIPAFKDSHIDQRLEGRYYYCMAPFKVEPYIAYIHSEKLAADAGDILVFPNLNGKTPIPDNRDRGVDIYYDYEPI